MDRFIQTETTLEIQPVPVGQIGTGKQAWRIIINQERMTHRESQRQRLSRAKHDTFNRWPASIVYANVQDIFSLFPGMIFAQKQYIYF